MLVDNKTENLKNNYIQINNVIDERFNRFDEQILPNKLLKSVFDNYNEKDTKIIFIFINGDNKTEEVAYDYSNVKQACPSLIIPKGKNVNFKIN